VRRQRVGAGLHPIEHLLEPVRRPVVWVGHIAAGELRAIIQEQRELRPLCLRSRAANASCVLSRLYPFLCSDPFSFPREKEKIAQAPGTRTSRGYRQTRQT
jgi:hypothetical protein